MKLLDIDFETASKADLKKVGGLCPAQHRPGIASPGYYKKVTEYG